MSLFSNVSSSELHKGENRYWNYYILLIFPLIYLILGYSGLQYNKAFFTTYPDSIYIYLVNGTNIASGNFNIGHYDNPGTPVHIIGGLIIFVTNLFVGKKGETLYNDVFSNPELYLNVCVIVILLLFIISVYLSARYIYRNTNNLILAVLFQLLPICTFFTIHYLLLVRLCPEDLIILILVYYYAFLFIQSYPIEGSEVIKNKKNLIIFSIVNAILITTKITVLPLLVFPLFYIPTLKQKIKYVFLTILFSLLILFPVWPKFPEMYDWYLGLATRSGNYGQGQDPVKLADLISNFLTLLKYDLFFTISYFILFLSIIVGLVQRKYRTGFYKFILGAFILSSFQLIAASKQFGYHYLIASQLIIIPSLICAFKLFFPSAKEKYFLIVLLLFAGTLFSFKTKEYVESNTIGENHIYESFINSKKYTDIPKIITTGYQGACFNESGLRFGASYGGPTFYSGNYTLRKLYPNSFFYDLHLKDNVVNWWDVRFSPLEFFQAHNQAVVYFIRESEEEEYKMMHTLTQSFEYAVEEIKLIEHNPKTDEKFYLVKVNKDRLISFSDHPEKLSFDFEKVNGDGSLFISDDNRKTIGGTEFSSDGMSFSKNRSILLPPDSYACCTTLVVKPGSLIDVSIRYNSPDRPAGITVSSASDPNIFNRSTESIMQRFDNGWKEVKLHCLVPLDCSDTKMNLCLFYWGKKKCYVDDLTITINNPLEPDNKFIVGKKFILKTSFEKYVTVDSRDASLTCTKKMSSASLFEAIDLGQGKVGLRTTNGKYVSVDRGNKNKAFANRDQALSWEMLEAYKLGDNKIALKSSNNNFISINSPQKDSVLIDANNQSREVFEYIEK
jgi:hypothetical protein